MARESEYEGDRVGVCACALPHGAETGTCGVKSKMNATQQTHSDAAPPGGPFPTAQPPTDSLQAIRFRKSSGIPIAGASVAVGLSWTTKAATARTPWRCAQLTRRQANRQCLTLQFGRFPYSQYLPVGGLKQYLRKPNLLYRLGVVISSTCRVPLVWCSSIVVTRRSLSGNACLCRVEHSIWICWKPDIAETGR